MSHVYLICGSSGGKTSNAIGATIRSLAHGKNVLFIQFLKYYKKTGEYIFSEIWQEMRDGFKKEGFDEYIDSIGKLEFIQFGRDGWIGLKNIVPEDRDNCLRAKAYALDSIDLGKVDLLVLDEINLVAYLKLLTIKEIKDLIDYCRGKNVTVFMTGRCPDRELLEKLLDMVDIGNEIRCIKSPKDGTLINEEGIQW